MTKHDTRDLDVFSPVNAGFTKVIAPELTARATSPTRMYFITKRIFDIVGSLLLLPVLIAVALVLLVLNPAHNKGPLFFVQTRMGRDCHPFKAIKFRSMTVVDKIERKADDPLETSRVTRIGGWLRRSRLDELPQILNVFRNEMSLIGPRPDYIEHAKVFLKSVEGYGERHTVLPGISGLAQTEVGYVEGINATRRKVAADLHYINKRSVWLEAWILVRTIQTVLTCKGS